MFQALGCLIVKMQQKYLFVKIFSYTAAAVDAKTFCFWV